MLKKLLAEFIGTFALIFAGTGAIIINQVTGGTPSHSGISAVFGLIVMVMIYTFGGISGAHLNPAVSLGFVTARRFKLKEAALYIITQLGASLVASMLLHLLFPLNETLGNTIPSGSNSQSFILEFILTFILMLVILSVSRGSKEEGITAAIAIGATVALEAMFAGPICGASMNPARSIGPSIVSGQLNFLWIYIFAPIMGAQLAVFTHKILSKE